MLPLWLNILILFLYAFVILAILGVSWRGAWFAVLSFLIVAILVLFVTIDLFISENTSLFTVDLGFYAFVGFTLTLSFYQCYKGIVRRKRKKNPNAKPSWILQWLLRCAASVIVAFIGLILLYFAGPEYKGGPLFHVQEQVEKIVREK